MAVIRGQDYDIQITLEDEDGTAVPPSTLDQLYIYIVNIRRARTLAIYSLNAKPGYETIEVVTDLSGIVKIIFYASDTTVAPIGQFRVEVNGKFPDADYENAQQDLICILNDADWSVSESKIKAQ